MLASTIRQTQQLCRTITSKSWVNRHKNDVYVKQAAKDDLRSRSAYKLIELQERFRFIQSHDYVIDLGSTPGGWSLATARILSPQGLLCSVDLLPMVGIQENVDAHFILGDFQAKATQDAILALGASKGRHKVDVVLSDMLQNTSGHAQQDHFRSIDLCLTALEFSQAVLKPGGSFCAKYLQGSDEVEFIQAIRKAFEVVKIVKPKASRSESSEIFVVARGCIGVRDKEVL